MTDEQALEIMAYLKAAYPRQEVTRETIAVYADSLRTLDAKTVREAVRTHVATQPFFPAISEILKPIAEAQVGAAPAEQAWLEVMRAIARWGRYQPWAFDNPVVGAAVDALGKDEICNSDNLDVTRAHFLRIYESYRGTELAAAKVAPLHGREYQPRLGPAQVRQVLLARKP